MAFIAITKERALKKNALNRVVPKYWFYSLVTLILGSFIPIHASVFQSLSFISLENPSSHLGMYPELSVEWTLNYEMFFYYLVAVLFLPPPIIVRLIGILVTVLLVLSLYLYISSKNLAFKWRGFLGNISFSLCLSLRVVLLVIALLFGNHESAGLNGLWFAFLLSLALIFTLTLSMLSYQLIEVRLYKTIKSRLSD